MYVLVLRVCTGEERRWILKSIVPLFYIYIPYENMKIKIKIYRKEGISVIRNWPHIRTCIRCSLPECDVHEFLSLMLRTAMLSHLTARLPKDTQIMKHPTRFCRPNSMFHDVNVTFSSVSRKASLPSRSSSRMNPGPLQKSLTGVQGRTFPHNIDDAMDKVQDSGRRNRFGIDCHSADKHPCHNVGASRRRTPEQRAERRRIISEFLQANICTS